MRKRMAVAADTSGASQPAATDDVIHDDEGYGDDDDDHVEDAGLLRHNFPHQSLRRSSACSCRMQQL